MASCPSECNHVYNTCGAAFFIWVNPMAVSTGFYFLSFIFAFANPDHKDASIGAFVKFFLVICFLMWVASSLAAANSGVADALFSFVVFMCFSAACVALMLLGKKQLVGKIEDGIINKMKAKYGGEIERGVKDGWMERSDSKNRLGYSRRSLLCARFARTL